MFRSQSSVAASKPVSTFYGLSSASQIQSSLSSSSGQPIDTDELNPDALFTRHTVSEVKVIQQRLRHDAEVKQEELRLMVGERYRDLIQASSSIISMSSSAQRVLSAFEESKGAILAQQEPPLSSHTTAFGGVNDRHLHSLQTLSAHLKVLLDAPEHLWRFIEKKKYLSAAWLFLFIRVVHRGLVQQDDEEEESWTKVGIDVPSEFPLVQRQWDEVSSFRSQIIHKATLSLRELNTSASDICAILAALHLLDSRPLSETFAALLTQRTKALTPLISWRIQHKLPLSANGHATSDDGEGTRESSGMRLRSVKEILQANQDALTTITDTVSAARKIFEARPTQKTSLITSLLKAIANEGDAGVLPPDLILSTHTLLVNSTSSAHFLLLPPNLQAYRPYIDLSSASTNYSQIDFQRALGDWFSKSSKSWKDAADAWFTNLANVAEIWDVRGALRKKIQNSELEYSEKEEMCGILDTISRSRALVVWRSALSNALDSFKKEVFVFLAKSRKEVTSGDTHFKAPPPPVTSSQASKALDLLPFRRYQSALKQYLLGRTAQLDAVVAILEQCARNIQKDLAVVFSDTTDEGKSFGQGLVDAYQPEAESTADVVALTLEEAVDSALGGSNTDNLVGLANIADDLGSSSIFITHIGCRRDVVQTLLSLSGALRDLGVRQEYIRHQPIAQQTLRLFVERYLEDGPKPPHSQDLLFLKAISQTYGSDWQEVIKSLSDSLGDSAPDSDEADKVAAEHLARTQTLLSLLLPSASRLQASTAGAAAGQFLLFDSPSSKQEYQPALEVAKPSPRFGLLLVGSAGAP
ncbi:hypothetical protein CC1G_01839 [Coprinopsis cinerea okayama7|uniref:Conserved oligomeric Golgi complex subunit 1 n=1 Tax=Coprinopsis cinerea (strain Okayama-7 / 130 / ATCC MYA-4618 / FGSC 9003) TaxID=240176 RepID=A8N2T7_COPC7|nr:hypothetical protein CC1G_01839 [Coprinopsis cinerea okayama7\|eukprot:XP_001829159.2 hypothetical protein CC1G_01839 [Coprinopsis cinerea okayama7\